MEREALIKVLQDHADAIDNNEFYSPQDGEDMSQHGVHAALVRRFAAAQAEDNPTFDQQAFIEECGY